MTANHYSYEADWRRYAFPPQASVFASEETLEEKYTRLSLERGVPLEAGGLPVASDGISAVINTENEHSLIYGGTASKKTRTLVIPLIEILAQSRESMVIMDIKGELSDGRTFPQIRGALEANGFECRFLNFRELNADGFNILLEPYRLYKSGQREEAIQKCHNIVESLAGIYHGTKADPFWEMTAKLYLTAIMILMFELCDDDAQINMLTLASYTDWNSCEDMKRIADLIGIENNIMTMLRSVTSEPEKTRMSTLATVNSMMTNFITNEKLLKMLSSSTFDLHDLGRKPTALFIILPDEVDTYAGIAGLLLQQISATLVQDAYQFGGKLPRRVNFLCDEFCNYYIPGMMRSISAHRSRNIRWYLVCQSQNQLEACYPNEAKTIIANCTNIYFLSSPELSLLEYLSRRAGCTTVTRDGTPAPLISVADLQGLKKGWTHTDVYFSSGSIHYVCSMPDIDQYPFAAGYTKVIPMPVRDFPALPIYSSASMLKDARALRYAYEAKSDGCKLSRIDAQLAKKYENLFK
ncbi:MAG: type IV secretory system conjugative DNA transfer family protein [Oscillospiraceae bacterium]|nr:type IV secretory system conjugative DNA transfer family protein [Oscillospiraceae bacterium]